MAEVLLPFPRSFVEFTDPAEPDQVFRCDLTWLTSHWRCLFGASGSGCPGIYADRPDDGCCTLGAHFSDADDRDRVSRQVDRLTAADWQYRVTGRRDGWSETVPGDPDEPSPANGEAEAETKTRIVDGACIFLNRPGFPAGPGCALHGLALRTGQSLVDTKPDVCWQLPIRRQYRTVDRGDGSEYLEITIGEYVRAAWGAGGHDLDWYCSANTEAHDAPDPVWRSARDELVALMGEPAYLELSEHCRRAEVAPHPAGQKSQSSSSVLTALPIT